MGFRDRMRDRDIFHVERPDCDAPACRNDGDGNFRRARLALPLGFQQCGGEGRGIDRHFEPRPQIDDGADMILVPVGDDERGEIFALLHQKADIGQHKIDAWHMLF